MEDLKIIEDKSRALTAVRRQKERKKERRGIIRRLGEFVGGLFGDDYDPWKVKEWRGTQEEKDQS